jgi:LmbE family N-acetylglucosaminyl deacetylase
VTILERDVSGDHGTPESAWRDWIGLSCLPVARFRGVTSAVLIATHPGDGILGAGGTMAVLAAAGVRLRVITITDGEGSHPGVSPALMAARRAKESAAAMRILQLDAAEVIRLGLPDTGLRPRSAELAVALRELCAGFDLCIAPWAGDAHADHEAAGRAAAGTCARIFSYPLCMWNWAMPADPGIPWRDARQVPMPGAVSLMKRSAIRAFVSQLTDRGADGPVLSEGAVAHFTRTTEVLFETAPARQRAHQET